MEPHKSDKHPTQLNDEDSQRLAPQAAAAPIKLHPSADLTRKMFEHLEGIHKLQSEIASRHQALEKVDLGVDAHFKSKQSDAANPGTTSAPRHPQDDSGFSALQESDTSAENVRQNFLNRQEGVNQVMSKLSDLSAALNEIHALGAQGNGKLYPVGVMDAAADSLQRKT